MSHQEYQFPSVIWATSTWRSMEYLRPPVHPVFRTPVAPDIDGRLDDFAWQSVPQSRLFLDIEGNAARQPEQHTRYMAAWDDDYLYVAIALEERNLWGTMTERNSVLYHENDVELFIDPDGDFHNYHEMEWNVLGTIWELSLDRPYRNGGPIRNPNNLHSLRYAVTVDGTTNDPSDTDVGWSVELAIPWSDMEDFGADPLPPEHGTAWRANLSRVQWPLEVDSVGVYRKQPQKREHNQVWSPTGLVDMHRPERWGWWIFMDSEDAWSGVEAELLSNVRIRQNVQDRLMAIYYHAAHYRGRFGHWPESATIPAHLVRPDYCTGFELREDGFLATAWACPGDPVSLQQSAVAYSIDNLGHLNRLK